MTVKNGTMHDAIGDFDRSQYDRGFAWYIEASKAGG
jgi:hypothetical protein